ncbi:MAG TPA: type II toxin-antitoxin system PemK/MazF family toxin [Isosphaeraceae bacterium]|jgi:mRNA interferase MazF|nr:type II toxin-antitoxin system PemK/MazF family toxin [Isosphaeraceae bacterium]
MPLEQGQVWWAALPDPVGRRPVLILTRSDALPRLLWATVAPLTRTIRGLESEVVLETSDDVPSRCVVTLDNIATIEQDSLVQSITTLSADRTNEVWEAIHFVFDLPY